MTGSPSLAEVSVAEGRASLLNRKLRSWRWGEVAIIAGLLLLIAVAIAPQMFTRVDPYAQDLSSRLLPPFAPGHVLGTDTLGRDLFARLLYAARPTMIVAAATVTIAAGIGLGVGLVSGLIGGWVDSVLMRLTDAFISLPLILLALYLVILTGPSMSNVVIAISALTWARYARIIRGEALSVRLQEFVSHARLSGASNVWLISKHLLPNVFPALLVLASIQVGAVVLSEASLSFLGAGVPAPTPSWGGMVADGKRYLATAWWVSGIPGIAVIFVVTLFNLGGDLLRDRLDPDLVVD